MLETEYLDATSPRAKTLNEAVELWSRCNEGKPARTNEWLPLCEIVARPDLFQVRGTTDAKHVADLADIIRGTEADLDPLLLIELGEEAVIVNGHHREAAYRAVYAESEPGHLVPVRWFSGGPVEALTSATGENSKTCLVMTREQRKDAATRLAGMVGKALSKAELAKVTGLSTTTIAEIRAGIRTVQTLAAGTGPLKEEALEALSSLKWTDIQACVDLSKGYEEQPNEAETAGVRFRIGEPTPVEAVALNDCMPSLTDRDVDVRCAPVVDDHSAMVDDPERDATHRFAELLQRDSAEAVRQLLRSLQGDAGPLARGVFDQMRPIAFLQAAGYVVRPQTADCLERMPREDTSSSSEFDF